MRSKSPEMMDRILDIVNSFFYREHRMPSVQEVATSAGVAKSTAHRYLLDMDKRGMITYRAGEILTRMIEGLSFSVYNAPLVGSVECGMPVEEHEYTEDYIPLPTAIFSGKDMFILKARGDSMIGAGIESGDYVVIQKQKEAHVGDIVVALVDHETNTLKRLKYDNERRCRYLHPENDRFEDMYFDDIEIQGVLINVIKNGPF